MTDEELLEAAKELVAKLLNFGDPWDGGDWSLVQVLNDYIKLKQATMSVTPDHVVK